MESYVVLAILTNSKAERCECITLVPIGRAFGQTLQIYAHKIQPPKI